MNTNTNADNITIQEIAAVYAETMLEECELEGGQSCSSWRRADAAGRTLDWLRSQGSECGKYAESVLEAVHAEFGSVNGPVERILFMNHVYAALVDVA